MSIAWSLLKKVGMRDWQTSFTVKHLGHMFLILFQYLKSYSNIVKSNLQLSTSTLILDQPLGDYPNLCTDQRPAIASMAQVL